MPAIVEEFKALYNRLNAKNTNQIGSVYADSIIFSDPVKTVHGIEDLKHYFMDLYSGVESCHFDFGEELSGDGRAFIAWTMHLRHRRLKPDETVEVPGVSYIEFAEKISLHRDYFDLGALVYERIPGVGSAVKLIKRRL